MFVRSLTTARRRLPRRALSAGLALFSLLATVVPTALVPTAQAAFPGTNGKVAYMSDVCCTRDIIVTDANGANATNVTKTSTVDEAFPAWSPDGEKIAYSSDKDRTIDDDIWVMNADGTARTRITTDSGVDPSWSPDMKRIVYNGPHSDITVVTIATKATDDLTDDGPTYNHDVFDSNPSWSPKGDLIAFRRQDNRFNPTPDLTGIWTVSPSGGSLTQVLAYGDEPSWSPDGTKIIFTSGTGVSVMPAGGGTVTPITTTANDSAPVFSPDGTKILFNCGTAFALCSAEANGSNRQALGYPKVNPDWQPLAPNDKVTLRYDGVKQDQFGTETFHVDADGLSAALATVTVKDDDGKPVSGETVTIEPNLEVDPIHTAQARNVVCRPNGGRLWPTRNSDGSLDFIDKPELVTDSNGQLQYQVLAGSQAGREWLVNAKEKAPKKGKTGELLRMDGQARTSYSRTQLIEALQDHLDLKLMPTLSAAGTTEQKQQSLLDWLGEIRWLAFHGTPDERGRFGWIKQVEFAPVHSKNGDHAGIVFYPGGSSPNPLLRYLNDAANPGQPTAYDVLDTDALKSAALEGHRPRIVAKGTLPTLANWQSEIKSQAVAGRLHPVGDEDLTYFGYPYPPPPGTAARGFFDRCISLPGLSATVHSPIALSFASASGKTLGVDGNGKLHYDIPGVMTGPQGGRPDRFLLPPGAYTVRIAGTGNGPATIVFTSPTGGADKSTVFTFPVTKGAKGSLGVTRTGTAATLTFGGKQYKAKSGVALRFGTLPAKLAPNKIVTLTVTVKDQFGVLTKGALVTVSTPSLVLKATSNATGRATFRFKTPAAGKKVTVAATGTGYLAATRQIPVKT